MDALRLNKIIERNLAKKSSVEEQLKDVYELICDGDLSEQEFVYLFKNPEQWNHDLNKD